MIAAIAAVLKSSFEAGLILALIAVGLTKGLGEAARQKAKRALWAGTGLALVSAFYVVFLADFFGDREVFEGYLSFAAAALLISLLVLLRRLLQVPPKDHVPSGKRQIFTVLFIIMVSWGTVLGRAAEVLVYIDSFLTMSSGFINTELIMKFAGILSGFGILALFILVLVKNADRISVDMFLGFSNTVISIMVFRQLVVGLQILFAIGMLPLTTWSLKVMAPLINTYHPLLYFLLIGSALILWIFRGRQLRNNPPDLTGAGNPAQRRKLTAGYLRQKKWLRAFGFSMLAIILVLGGNAALANQKAKLEPPVPVTADGGLINIPLENVSDGRFYRFSYVTPGNVETRFIVIRKGKTIYGTGLDACDICGNAGYYQRGDSVICRNCDVVINIPTIGFPGGCNPIPIKNTIEGDSLIINTENLESNQDIFTE